MYIPKYFKVENVDEILDFVQKNSFGTIVTTEQEKPIATHLPLGFNKKVMITISPAMSLLEIRSGELLKPVKMCLLCFRGRTHTFLLPGMGMRMFQHGIIKPSIYTVKQAF